MAAKQKYVPPIDPALAKDPAIQAAKIKVIGPLASQVQPQDDATDPTSNGSSETAAPTSAAPANVDLVKGFRHLTPLHVFRGRIAVQGYRDLPFEVPQHASLPRVSGTYKQLGGPSRGTGLLLLSDQQFQDFLRGGMGDAVFANDSLSGVIDIALSPTYGIAQKYHLLLRGSPRLSIPVQADFTVSFD